MNQYVIENNRFKTCFDQLEKQMTFSLTDKVTGRTWGPVPLLVFEIYDRMQERNDIIDDYAVLQVEQGEQQIHVTARVVFQGVTVGIWIELLENGELAILIPPAELEEAKEQVYRLYTLNVMPGLMSADANSKMLLPINTGLLCSPKGKNAMQDRFLIYGEQTRWELLPTCPVCGVQGTDGGLVAIATETAHDMYCSVSTDGKGNGQAGFHPMFRRNWVDPVDWQHRAIRIMALDPGEDLVIRAAKRLRQHVIDDLGKKTLKQRAEESPECAYQQRAYTMKIFHGIQQQGIMMYGRESKWDQLLYKRTLTFADAIKCFHRLKDAGLDRIYLQSVGWNPKGHDGAWPTDFPIDYRLGGEAAFRTMISEAKELGYHITTHLNMTGAYFSSPDYHKDWVIHDIWGEPKIIGFWGGGFKANHWGMAVPDEFLRGRLAKMKDLGFNGMQYLDGMGNPLYINYHPVNGGTRRQHANGINKFLDLSREAFGAAQTEMGFLYCVLHADAICYGGEEWQWGICKPEWPITALFDQRVPVWELALHDLITRENHGNDWTQTMKCILFGNVPRDEWSAEPGVMPVLTDERIASLKAIYDLCCERFGHHISEELKTWETLADGVEKTTFADGSEVVADFANQELTVNNERVEIPDALKKQ